MLKSKYNNFSVKAQKIGKILRNDKRFGEGNEIFKYLFSI